MLSQLGLIAVPQEVVEKLYHGEELTAEERALVEQAPSTTENLLKGIPRIDEVLEILSCCARRSSPEESSEGARVLRIALDLEQAETRHGDSALALRQLQSDASNYDKRMLNRLAGLVTGARDARLVDVNIIDLAEGMVFARDVVTSRGALLISRGQDVTPVLVQRLRSFTGGAVVEPLRVLAPSNYDEQVA